MRSLERVAGAPISWGVCEVPGWGHQLPPERVLSEMREVGFRATELGPDGFLSDAARTDVARDDHARPDDARDILDAHGLRVVAGFVPVVLHDEAMRAGTLEAVASAAERIGSLGGDVVVLAASMGEEGYEEAEPLDDEAWSALARGLDEAREVASHRGLVVAVHPHHGTAIERPVDVERLLDVSDAALCLDTGHVAVGGGDPLELARAAAPRVRHVHLKDVAAPLAERVASGEVGYRDAVRDGLYPPLGDGDLDLAAIVGALESSGYDGWYVLEHDEVLDREPAPGSGPIDDVRRSLAYLERIWEGAGEGVGTGT